MNKSIKKIVIAVIALVIIGLVSVLVQPKPDIKSSIKIGVITDLSGGAAYWGESTRIGVDILQKELSIQGKKVEFIFEDYGLEASKAINAAQKLVNVDKVDALYVEFNPGVIATAPFLKDKNIPLIYDAAIMSPLQDSKLFYKTYLNYQEGCKQVAEKFKAEGFTNIGYLKVNLEAGVLCENGINEVYSGDNLVSEGFNLGDTDFRTQLLKIKNTGAKAVIAVAFEGDTVNTLKIIRDYKYDLRYGTVDDSITQNVIDIYGKELKGTWTFGFNSPSQGFQDKLSDYKVATPYAAALAYTHLKQLVNAIDQCADDNACVINYLDNSPADSTIGFQGYQNHVADLVMSIKKY